MPRNSKRERRKSRQERIAKFAARQRVTRRWIEFADLVKWCVESTTASLDDEEMAGEVAYRRLIESVRRGEFERAGRSKILYLDALVTSDGASPRCRLTRDQFERAVKIAATPPAPSLPITVLNCCWLPSDLARHWLESHGYRSAPHLAPTGPNIASRNEQSGGMAVTHSGAPEEGSTRSGFAGRPGKAKHLIEDEFERRTKSGEALRNLADEAAALLDWLKEVHPNVPRPTKRTIENNIRGDYRRWKATIREADPP